MVPPHSQVGQIMEIKSQDKLTGSDITLNLQTTTDVFLSILRLMCKIFLSRIGDDGTIRVLLCTSREYLSGGVFLIEKHKSPWKRHF